MKHYILYKFDPGTFTDEDYAYYEKAFQDVCDAIPGIRSVSVRRNCVERDINMDCMVVMEMDGPEVLPVYREHPLHLKIAAYNQGKKLQWFPFDCD